MYEIKTKGLKELVILIYAICMLNIPKTYHVEIKIRDRNNSILSTFENCKYKVPYDYLNIIEEVKCAVLFHFHCINKCEFIELWFRKTRPNKCPNDLSNIYGVYISNIVFGTEMEKFFHRIRRVASSSSSSHSPHSMQKVICKNCLAVCRTLAQSGPRHGIWEWDPLFHLKCMWCSPNQNNLFQYTCVIGAGGLHDMKSRRWRKLRPVFKIRWGT